MWRLILKRTFQETFLFWTWRQDLAVRLVLMLVSKKGSTLYMHSGKVNQLPARLNYKFVRGGNKQHNINNLGSC